jgi:uncharacterized RDD family membrane protein YckC
MALFIDGCLITLILGVVGFALFGPTDGRVRVDNMLVGSQTCYEQNLQALQEFNLPLPADFQVTQVARCTKSILGHVHDRVLILAEITRSGAVTQTRQLTFPLDAEGRPVQVFYLDNLWFLIFAAYVLFMEWRAGRTLGKDLMNIRVQSVTGAPPSFVQVVKRFLIRFFPMLVEGLVFISLFGVTLTTAPGFFWLVWLVSLLSFAAIAVNVIVAVRRNTLPWHDRLAGTEVVLGR